MNSLKILLMSLIVNTYSRNILLKFAQNSYINSFFAFIFELFACPNIYVDHCMYSMWKTESSD